MFVCALHTYISVIIIWQVCSIYVHNTYICIMYVYVCTCTPSPQGETVVDLVDEEHSKEFEELKTVAEAAQGVSAGRVGRCPTATHLSLPLSAGRVGRCPTATHLSLPLSHCPSAVATYVLLVFKSPFIYIHTFAVVGIISQMYLRIYSTYVCTYVCASLCLTISVRTYMFVSVCVCVCMLSCSPVLSGQVYVCMYSKYVCKGWMCCVQFQHSLSSDIT